LVQAQHDDLCTRKDHTLVEYALADLPNQIFVAKYQLELPSKKQIQEFMDVQIGEVGSIKDAVDNHGRVIDDTCQHVSQLGLENSSARLLRARTVCLLRTASVGYLVVKAP
jgi:type I restriction enzyme S subunit